MYIHDFIYLFIYLQSSYVAHFFVKQCDTKNNDKKKVGCSG